MKHYYRIGNLTIEYDGLPFEEKEELAVFRIEAAANVEIRCILKAVADVAPISKDGSTYEGHWKSDLELICGSTDCRKIYLTDRRKKTELLIEETLDNNKETGMLKGIDDRQLSMQEEKNNMPCCLHQAQLLDTYAESFGISTILRVMDLPFETLRHGGVFLHASYIEWNGKAILFTAPKQTGKSTQAALWEQYNQAVIVNGDRVLLQKENGIWHAFGSPYCGTSHICRNKTLPVAAIIILGQAKNNYLAKANTMQALQALLDGCSYESWDKKQVMTVMDIAEDLIKNVPFWKLDCLPNESAVRLLEKVL